MDNVVELPKRDSGGIWCCGCGQASMLLYQTGEVECNFCGEVQTPLKVHLEQDDE